MYGSQRSGPGGCPGEVAPRRPGLGTRTSACEAIGGEKWIRIGLRGVRLTAFPWRKTFRIHEQALDDFIHAVQNAPAASHRGNGDQELSRLDEDIAANAHGRVLVVAAGRRLLRPIRYVFPTAEPPHATQFRSNE